jgi:hypothetical protein
MGTNSKVSIGKVVASGDTTSSTLSTSKAMTSLALKRTSTYTKSLLEKEEEEPSRLATRKVNEIEFEFSHKQETSI